MSLQFRISDQILRCEDTRDATEALVHKYDAFLNLISSNEYSFQHDAVRSAWRFLVSDKYPNLESLARENWQFNEHIRQHHGDLEIFLSKVPLRDKKAISIDLATGTGKSFVLYALAAIALAEGLVDRVLVLCPSLTIEEGLLDKFSALAGNPELSAIMQQLGAVVSIPGIRRGNNTVQVGEICVENIHAAYENAGTSIADSFKGRGGRTLVLNDEAHHLFSPPDTKLKEWLKFLLHHDYGFRYIVNVTGTPYVDDNYFPDVIFRFGLKQAIDKGIVKKPNYKLEDTFKDYDWQKTYAIHQKNQEDYGTQLKPISIVVTQEIARCVEVWQELIAFLEKQEGITRQDAEKKAIWVTSGIPSGKDKARVEAAFGARDDKDSPEKRRQENLTLLKTVDDSKNPVEWIVSVSMLTEGWDVKNVFQIVPHESRAFSSKLLIAQVLGRGLRVPPALDKEPLVTINNHEAWSGEIANLLREVLEIENVLSWGYEPHREKFVFPLYNLRYEPEQTTVEVKREQAGEPDVKFQPQEKNTTEYSKFSETGMLAIEIQHNDFIEIDGAVKLMRLFLREKDEKIASAWTKKRLKEFIVERLEAAGQDTTYLSRENLTLLQQGFGPMFRNLGIEHPRMSQIAKDLTQVNLTEVRRQSFSESTLKEHGALYYVKDEEPPFTGHELNLWEQYQKYLRIAEIDETALKEDAVPIVRRLHQKDAKDFKSPWNIHFASHEPERRFSDLLFENADLLEAFIKMPDQGSYSFPYSYKPSKTGRTQTVNENFNPDYFIRVKDSHDILVVEIKSEGDDSNRNRAKYRDGKSHFNTLNDRLRELGEPWCYNFYFLSPEDYTIFFERVRQGKYSGWKSSLMQELE